VPTTNYSLEGKEAVYGRTLPAVFRHGSRKFPSFPSVANDTRTAVAYIVVIYSQNGETRQEIRLDKGNNGQWTQRYVVTRIDTGGNATIVKRYPEQ
jgi:hypothetical protein